MRIPLVGWRGSLRRDETVSANAEYDTDNKGVWLTLRGRGDWETPGFWKRLIGRLAETWRWK